MGLSPRVQTILGGAIVLASLGLLHGIPGRAGAPEGLNHDHTKSWAYIREPHRAATADERLFGDIGSVIAGRPVQVRCEEFSIGTPEEPGGVVQFNGNTPANYARIRPDQCTALRRFRSDPQNVSVNAVEAVTVLTHESEHLAGVKNEAAAQCYAIQDLPRVAHAFGASPLAAKRMALFEYAAVQPNMPANYRSAECRPGGRLDGHGALDLAALTSPN